PYTTLFRSLEPPRPKPLPPQGSASTNSATWARFPAFLLVDRALLPRPPALAAGRPFIHAGRRLPIVPPTISFQQYPVVPIQAVPPLAGRPAPRLPAPAEPPGPRHPAPRPGPPAPVTSPPGHRRWRSARCGLRTRP